MQPNMKKHTVLPISDGIQGVKGKPDVASGKKICHRRGVFKKITAWSG